MTFDFQFTQPNGMFYALHDNAEPEMLEQAYSGKDHGINDPGWEHVVGLGVIPANSYTILAVDLTKHPEWAHMGPVIFQLIPDDPKKMYGRASFFIHWGMRDHTMRASEGCIILEYQWVFDRITAALRIGKNRLLVTPTTIHYPPPTPKPVLVN